MTELLLDLFLVNLEIPPPKGKDKISHVLYVGFISAFLASWGHTLDLSLVSITHVHRSR